MSNERKITILIGSSIIHNTRNTLRNHDETSEEKSKNNKKKLRHNFFFSKLRNQ